MKLKRLFQVLIHPFVCVIDFLSDTMTTIDPIMDNDIADYIRDDSEDFNRHINLRSKGKPGLEKYKHIDVIR